jgi:predicted lipid-binding transport protein (Tim44 family)
MRRPRTNRFYISLILSGLLLVALGFIASGRPGGGHTYSGSSGRSSSGRVSAGTSSSGGSRSSSSGSSGLSSSGASTSVPSGGSYGRSRGGSAVGLIIFLFIMVFVVVVLVVAVKMFKGSGGTPPPLAPEASADLAAQLALLRQNDPNFSRGLFADFVCALYARAHEGRGKGAVDVLAPYIDERSQQQLVQLGSSATGLSEVAGIVVGASNIVDVRNMPDGTGITVFFEANYTEIFANGQQVSYYTEERWQFWRQLGVLSLPPGKIDAIHCPKCGGPLERNENGLCPYCNTVIRGGQFHWYVVNMEVLERNQRGPQLTQDTPEEGTDLPTIYQPEFNEYRARLQAASPDFSWDRMNERVLYIFNAISQAWTSLEWEKARPFETDNIFQMHKYWIEAYKRQGLRNVLDKINVSKIEWVKIDQDAFYDSLTARIWASELDFTVDSTGRVLCGSPTTPRAYTEYWTFIRTRGAKAPEHKDDHCPNCGAPLAISMAGICDYCGGKITSGDFDWVLSRIEQDESYTG